MGGVKFAYNNFIKGCKNDGIWDAIKACCILAGARTTNGALVPLVGDAPTPYNFDLVGDTDYNRVTGLKGDGSTKYLDSNRLDSADPQDNAHFSFYVATAPSSNDALMFTNYGANATGLFYGTSYQFYLRAVTPLTTTAGSTGFVGASRSGATSSVTRVSGANTSSSVASTGLKNESLIIFNDQTKLSTYASTARISFYSIGESLDLALLDTRVSNLMTAIGAAIP